MSTLPRITVVTPSYNQAPFLADTLRSVLDQGYPKLEYIVLDGGSTDGSADIIRRHADRLTYWRSAPDGGQAAALADGFRRATGDVLCWVNSDDVLLPGTLAYVGEQFARHGDAWQWLIGGTVIIDEVNRAVEYRPAFPAVTFNVMLWGGCGFYQPSCFWRRSLYEAVGGLDPTFQFCMDYDLFVRFADRTRPRRTRRRLSAFRVHAGAKTTRLTAIQKREDQRIRDHWARRCWRPRAFLYWFSLAAWSVATTRYARRPETLPALDVASSPLGNGRP